MDLYWRDLLEIPTLEQYLDMVSNSMFRSMRTLTEEPGPKPFQIETGGLFRLAIKLMQAESESTMYVQSLITLGELRILYDPEACLLIISR